MCWQASQTQLFLSKKIARGQRQTAVYTSKFHLHVRMLYTRSITAARCTDVGRTTVKSSMRAKHQDLKIIHYFCPKFQ
jgi:hypothetical protein